MVQGAFPHEYLTCSPFGATADGLPVTLFTLSNRHGLLVRVATLGAAITELHIPDRRGVLGDVVLGFDHLAGYLARHPHFGVIAGRVANRIAGASFELEGASCQLIPNEGRHTLHGGPFGFDKKVWQAHASESDEGPAVSLSLMSPHGDQGFPGNLIATVRYTLTHANALRLDYWAVADRPTVVNLTNHSYFNLAGRGDVLRHELAIAAEAYTPSDEQLIPTGEILPVEGTPLDFRKKAEVGARMHELPFHTGGGYDHNYVLDAAGRLDRLAARLRDPGSGRVLEVYTTQPGLQLYTGNHLDGTLTGKHGWSYGKHAGICLETQHFPDAVHHPNFPSIVLKPGEIYRQTTIWRFLVEG
ncbi:MAG: aldose epimerase family protein [Chthonomonadales bacterium]